MINLNDKNCPICGGELKYYDRVKRIVRTKKGKKNDIHIKRFRCKTCNGIHREIVDDILPNKHYEREIILGVIERYITNETLGFENYPSEITMKRWLNEF